METREKAVEKLSQFIGQEGKLLEGTEEGTFVYVNNFALAILVEESSEGIHYYTRQEVILLSAIESIKLNSPSSIIEVAITMKSGAVESFNIKTLADTGAILQLLVEKIKQASK